MLSAVSNLWIVFGKLIGVCGQAVHKSGFTHTHIISVKVCAQNILKVCTVFMNSIFVFLTGVVLGLYTASTGLTKTIYLNKKEYI